MNQNNNEHNNENTNEYAEQKQFYMLQASLPEKYFQEKLLKYFSERKKDSRKLGNNGIDEHFLMENGAEFFLFWNYTSSNGVGITIFCHSTPSYHERGLKALEKIGEVKNNQEIGSLDAMLRKMGVLRIDRLTGDTKYASFNLPSGTYS